jgi:hypothetical protein
MHFRNVAQTFYNGTIPEMNWDLVKVMYVPSLSYAPLVDICVNYTINFLFLS